MMDGWCWSCSWLRRALICAWASGPPLACATYPMTPQCGPGEALADGQCVPTPSLVFSRCVETFRKTRSQRHDGELTRVSASVPGRGGAALEHGQTDERVQEYAGLPDELLPEAIAECRRQEEQERENLIARVRSEVDEQRERTRAAQARAEQAEHALSDLSAVHESASAEIEGLQAALAETKAELDGYVERLRSEHPCIVQDWAACTDKAEVLRAAGDHTAAAPMFDQACDGGAARACRARAERFEHGQGVPADLTEATVAYARACDAGDAESCLRLARRHETGDGLPEDRKTAMQLYTRACKAGSQPGCRGAARLEGS